VQGARGKHGNLAVRTGIRSALLPFQGRWQCASRHSLKYAFNMLASTAVRAAWSLALRPRVVLGGGARVTHWADWPTQCVTLAKFDLKGCYGDSRTVQLENMFSATIWFWKYCCMISWHAYILKHCQTFTVNYCVNGFAENIVKLNTSMSSYFGRKHPCITESRLQQAVAVGL